LKEKAQEVRPVTRPLTERLARLLADFDVEVPSARRLVTARAAEQLVEQIAAAEPDAVISKVAAALVATTEAAMGRSLARARPLVEALEGAAWQLIESVGQLTDDRAEAGHAIRQRVADALEADELAVPLAPAIKAAQDEATRLLVSAPLPPPPRGGQV